MLTLIKREIYDHIAYFVGAFIFSFVLIAIISSAVYSMDIKGDLVPVLLVICIPIIVFIFGSTGMGVSQMSSDRTKKISAFISTLPVTRSKILFARICAGILAISVFFLPLIITSVILYPVFAPPIPLFDGIFFDVFSTGILMSFACYCIGLQTGWSNGRVFPSLGGFILTAVLVSLIVIKGIGIEILLLLILVIITSLIRIRYKFISTSL